MRRATAATSEPPALTGLPPVLPRRVHVLILGSFPSPASLQAGQYYAHPRNWFWRVLAACDVAPAATAPYATRIAAMRARGIGIWDLYQRVNRVGSGDDAIRDAEPNDLRALWRERGPFRIVLNGRRRPEWRRLFRDLPVEPVCLPSTSPRPLHWNTEERIAAAIAEWCAALTVETRPRPRRRD